MFMPKAMAVRVDCTGGLGELWIANVTAADNFFDQTYVRVDMMRRMHDREMPYNEFIEHMDSALRYMLKECRRLATDKVVVNCHRGINRSAAFIIYWHMSKGMLFSKSLACIIKAKKNCKGWQTLTNQSFRNALLSCNRRLCTDRVNNRRALIKNQLQAVPK